jgi:N-acylglucosamine 2-epimerase
MWSNIIKRYEKELLESVIPFWQKNSPDSENGGYYHFLDRDGSVFETKKFMWMEWRIVYMFSTLYNSQILVESQEIWLNIAKQGYEFLTKHGKDADGNFYFALNKKGRPISGAHNIYSEAFAVMGSAALFKACGEEKYKKQALESMNNYIQRIQNPKGKWNKGMPDAQMRKTMGHYMIMANLGTVINDCIGIDTYNQDINDAVSNVIDHFYNEEFKILFENINPDHSFDLESCEGRHLIPGHGIEACWFILQYAEANNRQDIIDKTCKIIKNQLNFAWDTKFGGLYYFMDVLDKPHEELTWDMKLWWVHNEALIACLYAFRLSKDSEFLEWFKKVDEWTWKHFPDQEYGEWFGYLNRRGEPTHNLKGGKWKTFFHLPRCLLLCIEQIQLIEEREKNPLIK